MPKIIKGEPQNYICLSAYEATVIEFNAKVGLELINIAATGTVWMKWHGDSAAEIDGATSTPLPAGVAYQRERFPLPGPVRLGLISDTDVPLVVNVI